MRPRVFRDEGLEALFDRAWSRSRLSVRTRFDRLHSKLWHIGQCAIAAGVAWFIAGTLFHHPQPVFAPIIAVVCLGMTYGQRLRRVVEVTIGVAVGLVIADVFVHLAGTGPWQIGLIVLCSMSISLLLDAGNLLVMQSAVQSIFVVAFVSSPGQAFTRWTDAVIGGWVALAAAAVVPGAPLRRPRVVAAKVARTIAQLLRDAAVSGHLGDAERAATVLARARDTQSLIRELQAAADEGLDIIAVRPHARSTVQSVRTISQIVEPLDRVVRSTRVLVRRVSIAAHNGVTLPPAYEEVLLELAAAVDVLERAWGEDRMADFARPAFLAVGHKVAALDPGNYYTTIILGQLRSLVVDLLELTGLDHDDAVTSVVFDGDY